MRCAGRILSTLFATALSSCAAPTTSPEPAPLSGERSFAQIEALSPAPGAVSVTEHVEIRGRVRRQRAVILLLDVSGSAHAPSGHDVDGDGVVGRQRLLEISDPDDTVLMAEVRAAKMFLATLARGDAHVAVIAFGSTAQAFVPLQAAPAAAREFAARTPERPRSEPCETWLDLPARFACPNMTNLVAAWREAVSILSGAPAGAAAELVLLSEGPPTAPGSPGQGESLKLTMAALELLAKRGIAVHTFDLVERGSAFRAASDHTDGVHLGPLDATRIAEVFAPIQRVSVMNVTTGAEAVVDVDENGAFAAPLSLAPGANQIEVRSVASSTTGVLARTTATRVVSPPPAT